MSRILSGCISNSRSMHSFPVGETPTGRAFYRRVSPPACNNLECRILSRLFLIIILLLSGLVPGVRAYSQEKIRVEKDPFTPRLKKAIDRIEYDALGNGAGKLQVKKIDGNTAYIKIAFTLDKAVRQDDWQVNIRPAFVPSFNWAPHLTPAPGNIIAQHVFRAPALIVSDGKQMLVVIPDPDVINKKPPVRW